VTAVPELPEVETVRRLLAPVLVGERIDEVVLRRADLRGPFPDDFAARLTGRTVLELHRRAKHLLADLSSGETLLMHLGMSGDFRVEHGAELQPLDKHDHVILRLGSGVAITFNDPRRFGSMDLVRTDQLAEHPVIGALGPEPLSASFTPAALARACRGRTIAIKVALLDQRIVAGLGNIYVVEALHRAGLSPLRRASTLATKTGAPREPAVRLVPQIKKVLAEAIARAAHANYRGGRFRVYDRAGKPCLRPRCGGTIRARTQAGRSTFYCPLCQR
jgi:formamidopyrimidine-DNA glycosylase